MKPHPTSESRLPTILIVQDDLVQIGSDSSILALFNKVYIPQSQNRITLSWIQQNQPNLIFLELTKCPEQNYLSLITLLRLDWLTRDIPIVIAGSAFVFNSVKNLDYNTYLTTPYSTRELEEVICSLTDTSCCKIFA